VEFEGKQLANNVRGCWKWDPVRIWINMKWIEPNQIISRAQSWCICRLWKHFWGFASPKATCCGTGSHLFLPISHDHNQIRIGNSLKIIFLDLDISLHQQTILLLHSFWLHHPHHGKTQSHRGIKSGRISWRGERTTLLDIIWAPSEWLWAHCKGNPATLR
jgi:hypothetical protein